MNQRHKLKLLCMIALGVLAYTERACSQATSAENRLASWKHHVLLEKTSAYKDLQWRALGPTRQGGRIEALACHGSTIYVGAGSGNLWKSVNNGITWLAVFEKESAFSIGDVALAPSNPNIVWLGTGETQPRHSGYSYSGTGVFKSTDGGSTWSHVGLAETHHIGKLLVHPTDPDTVYVAAIGHAWTDNPERGLYKTTDGGGTWEHVLAISDQTGVVDLVMDPEDPETIYATAWHKTRYKMAGPESGIYKSTDGGANWKRLGGGLPEGIDMGRSGIAVAATNPNVVYAFIDNCSPAGDRIVGAEVYRSNDKGQTWKRTHVESLYDVYTEYGWKFADIRIAPDDENELFILGNRVYHSQDAGKTFERISEKIVRLHDHKTLAMHLDHHDMWIDPEDPDRVLLGNDGGLFISYDRGATWLHINNLPIGEFYTIHIDESVSPFEIYGGTQDNASHVGPSTAQLEDVREDDWSQVFLDRWGGGDGFVTLPDPTDREWVYYEHQHGDIYRKKLGGSPLTGAKGDKRIRPRSERGKPPYRFGWHTPFIISHYNPLTLYVGGNKLLKSIDRGEHWSEVSPEFAQKPELGNRGPAPLGVITSIAESRLQHGLIYVGLDNGQVHRTSDDGHSWTKCHDGLPRKWVSRVVASQHELGTVYASHTGYRDDDFSTYLYRSTDHGATWKAIANNLPAESVNVIREDSRSADVLYVGTDLGVYVSTNRGESWQSLCATLPTTPVHDLAFHPIEHKLVIGTHGRSVFLLDAKTIMPEKGTLNPDETVSVHKYAEEVAEAAHLRSLGPAFKPGRVAEIAVDPTDRSTWYLALGSGGLWKTTNRGNNWKPIFDEGGSYSLGHIAVDPRNPAVLWLGTGENISNRSVGYGDGIYKSNDGGETWTNVGLRDSQHIGKIIIHPRDSRVVYVAAEGPLWSAGGDRGLYKTVDGGLTWRAVLQISEDTGVTDMTMDPRDPNVIYASSYQRRRRVGQLIGGGPESAIYKTTDGGNTWRKLTAGIPSVDKGRIALAVSPQNPDIVYALITAAGKEGGFFRSADRGETWLRRSDYRVVDPQYYGEIYADPHHFDRIYAMDVRIHVSENGGETFRPLRWNMHVDNHAMVFDYSDPDHLLVGNDGGLYESYDKGDTWRHFTNLPTSQFYRVALDDAVPFYNVYGGTQDNGSMAGPSRTVNRVGIRTSEWIRTRGGDGFQTRIDPDDPDIVYTLSQNGDLGRLNKRTGQSKGIRPKLPPDQPPVRWHWDSPLIISPHSPTRLYFAGSRLFRSDDRGDSWRPVSEDLTYQLDRDALPIMGQVWSEDAVQKHRFTTALSVISALDESPLKEGLLLVGTDDGLLQISENGGDRWSSTKKFPNVPLGTYVSDVCASAHDAETLYVSLNNHKRGDFRPYLLKSSDLGKTWKSISANLPMRHVIWCVIEDHVNSDLLFVGTELGLLFTVNGGEHWFPIKDGAPPIAFRDLAIQRREQDLVGATFGRGFFILDDISVLRHLNSKTLVGEGGLFPPRDTWVYEQIGYVEATFGNYSTPNPPFGSKLSYYLRDGLPKGEGNRIMLSIESADGSTVRLLPGPGTAGVHRVQWDLRHGRQRGGNGRSGILIDPGEYIVRLLRVAGGKQSVLGESRTITVKALPEASSRNRE
jgi:photosystem II stability/assembly factor-like uncharacterized protein